MMESDDPRRGQSGAQAQAVAHSPQRQHMKRQIDENLKRIYNQTLEEEIPDRFKNLLAQLGNLDLKQADEK